MRYVLIGLALLAGLAASAALVVRSFQAIPDEPVPEQVAATETKAAAPAAPQQPIARTPDPPAQLPVAAAAPAVITALPPSEAQAPRPQGADTGPLRLTEEQRGRLREILLTHNVMQAEADGASLRIGAMVPQDVTLSPLPIEIADAVPAYARYSYVIAENRIAIVRNERREIEAVIPF